MFELEVIVRFLTVSSSEAKRNLESVPSMGVLSNRICYPTKSAPSPLLIQLTVVTLTAGIVDVLVQNI